MAGVIGAQDTDRNKNRWIIKFDLMGENNICKRDGWVGAEMELSWMDCARFDFIFIPNYYIILV